MAFIKQTPAGASVEQRLSILESNMKIVSDLANSGFLIAPYQKSPVAGELIAGRITTGQIGTKPWMALDLIQSAAGKGPAVTVNDGTYNRAQMGNLADYVGPNGIDSPAQYGFRAVDASGNTIFDSLGLTAVAKVVASQIHAFGTGQTITGVAGPGGLGGGGEQTVDTVTFSVANRNTTYMLAATYVGYVQCTSGPFTWGNMYFKVDGTARTNMVGTIGTYGNPLPAYLDTFQGFILDFVTLTPGSHTITLTWDMFEGTSDHFTVYSDGLFVIQLGG